MRFVLDGTPALPDKQQRAATLLLRPPVPLDGGPGRASLPLACMMHHVDLPAHRQTKGARPLLCARMEVPSDETRKALAPAHLP